MLADAGQDALVTPVEGAVTFLTVSAIIGLWIWGKRKKGPPVRFRLRTLMIALAVLPPAFAAVWWLCLNEGFMGMLKIGMFSIGIAAWIQIAIRRTMGW